MTFVKTNSFKIFRFVILILLVARSIEMKSQIDFKSLEFNTVKENVFQRPVTALAHDKNGFLWIGTEGAGLYKYNGFSYTYYRHDIDDINSINSNSIRSLFLDTNDQLWIGTDAGLSVYNEEQNSFERFNSNINSDTLAYNYVTILCFAEYDGRFLVGTYDGIKELDLKNGILKDYNLNGYGVLDLKFSTKGDLYIATDFGLKVERYHKLGEIEDIILLKDKITSLHIDKHEVLWIGTLKSGTFRGDLRKANTTYTKINIVDSATMAITSGIDHVFVAIENEGLFVLDMTGEIVKHYQYNVKDNHGIGSDSIWSMLLDNENRLWLGYYENGLGFYDEHYNKFKSIQRQEIENTIYSNYIKAFAKTDDGKIWIAQINGIDILNTQNGIISNAYGTANSKYEGLKEGLYIEDLFIDSKGNVWLATWDEGIFFLEKGSTKFLNFNKENSSGILKTNKVRCFTEDSSGRVWIGSFLEGVFYYDLKAQEIKAPKSQSYLNSEIVNKDVKVLYYDSSGHLWVGTSSGLYYIKEQDNSEFEVANYTTAISSKFVGHPSSSRILDIHESQDGTLWFGTNGGGLFEFKRDKHEFKRLELDGYDLSFVNAIFEPVKDELWVSSKQGLLKINRNTDQVSQFNIDDGLLENFLIDRAVIMGEDNQLYLGTKSGVNTVNPQNIDFNPYLGKPYLKEIKLFNKKINQRDENSPLTIKSNSNTIKLKHNQTVLTIGYEAISFTRPEKNRYAYLLDGFEDNWNYVGSKTTATYTNLDPGDYTFKLKVANNDNVWSEVFNILNIHVSPPWWKTIWAYILYAVIFIFFVFSITYLYRKRVSEINTFRLERERRRQKGELQQQKLQFFTNISHEFRTPLTLIINPIKELIESNSSEFSKSVMQKHHIIHKNAERLSRLINELMDFRKLQSDKLKLKVSQFNIVKNTKNILSFFNEESKRRKIQFDFKYDNINLDIWADSGILDKVLFNLLSNAFKVTPNKGKISLKIKSESYVIMPLVNNDKPIPVIEISVRDNGPGIDQKDYKKIFDRFYQVSELNKSYYGSTGVGLEMVKSFVKLHKGMVEVESELGKGSVFKVIIPHGKEFFIDEEIILMDNDKRSTDSDAYIKNKSNTYKIEDILSKKVLKNKLLIVEDNTDLQDYLVSILEDNYNLVIASDGQEGWLKTIEHRPDIIITDVIMPIMDGIEFCKKVKNDPTLNQTPIVMLTAKNLSEDRIKGMKVGAEAYLVKPFDNNELKVVLEQLLLKKKRLTEQYSNITTINHDKKETDLDNDFIQKVLNFIYDNIENSSLNVEKLSSHLCLSRSQVYRKIKALTGLSPIEFIRRVRLERSRTIFKNDKNLNVSEVAHKVGFLSASYFTVCYKKQFGELPRGRKVNS